MLHKKRITFTVIRFFVLRKQSGLPIKTPSAAVEGESRRRPPVAEISSAAFSCETSDLASGESRRLSMRTGVRSQAGCADRDCGQESRRKFRRRLSHAKRAISPVGEQPTTASGGNLVGCEVIRKGVSSTVVESRPLRMRELSCEAGSDLTEIADRRSGGNCPAKQQTFPDKPE